MDGRAFFAERGWLALVAVHRRGFSLFNWLIRTSNAFVNVAASPFYLAPPPVRRYSPGRCLATPSPHGAGLGWRWACTWRGNRQSSAKRGVSPANMAISLSTL